MRPTHPVGILVAVSIAMAMTPGHAAPRPSQTSQASSAADPAVQVPAGTGVQDPVWNSYVHASAGIEAREAGRSDDAIREFTAAAQANPQWASPHFSLAWAYLTREPGWVPTELLLGSKLALASFRFQHLLLFHLLLWGLLAGFLGLLALGLSAVLIGAPDLHHRLTEFFSAYLDRSYSVVVAGLALFLPYVLGLGVILPTLFLLGMLQQSMRGTARRVWALILVSTLSLPWLVREVDSLLLPRDPGSLAGRILSSAETRWNPGTAAALREADAQFPGHYEIPFSRGLAELRDGRIDAAVHDLSAADSLSHTDARVLNDLGVAQWMQGHSDAAETSLRASIRSEDRLAAPHYNLAQVLSRRLAFDEANREMLRAGSLDFDRLRRHIDAYGAGRTAMMLEEPSPESLWRLWREETSTRADWTEAPIWLAAFWETRTGPFSVLAVLALLFGLLAGRALGRWLSVGSCANCGALLCRRCSGRRRGETFCQTCIGHLTATGEGPYARVLLDRRRNRQVRERGWAVGVLSVTLPPLGSALTNRWTASFVEWTLFAFLLLASVKGGFWIHGGPNLSAGLHSTPVTCLWGCVWFALWAPLAAREWRRHIQRVRLELDAGPVKLEKAA